MIFDRSFFSDAAWDIALSDEHYLPKLEKLLRLAVKENPQYELYVWLINEYVFDPMLCLHSANSYDMLKDAVDDFVESGNEGYEDRKTGSAFYYVRDRHRAARAIIFAERKKICHLTLGPAPVQFIKYVSKLILMLEPQRYIEQKKNSQISFMELPSFFGYILDYSSKESEGVFLKIEPLGEEGLLNRDVCNGAIYFARLMREWQKLLIQVFDKDVSFYSGFGCTLYAVVHGDSDEIVRTLRDYYEASHELAVPLFDEGTQKNVSWPVAFIVMLSDYANLTDFYFDRTQHTEGFFAYKIEKRIDAIPEDIKPVISDDLFDKEAAPDSTATTVTESAAPKKRSRKKKSTDEGQVSIFDNMENT